jgi:hypothetical protein
LNVVDVVAWIGSPSGGHREKPQAGKLVDKNHAIAKIRHGTIDYGGHLLIIQRIGVGDDGRGEVSP